MLWIFIVLVLVAALITVGCRATSLRSRVMPKPSPSSSPATPGKWRAFYRTKDGRADYEFSFERKGSGYRIYILAQPPYGRRSESLILTHRLTDGGRRYACWTGVLSTLEAAKAVAAMWADGTQEYIRTGKRF